MFVITFRLHVGTPIDPNALHLHLTLATTLLLTPWWDSDPRRDEGHVSERKSYLTGRRAVKWWHIFFFLFFPESVKWWHSHVRARIPMRGRSFPPSSCASEFSSSGAANGFVLIYQSLSDTRSHGRHRCWRSVLCSLAPKIDVILVFRKVKYF
jgi:hypothetical protein